MVLLGGLSYIPGLENIADVNHLFDGFASNAVISIIAVMIIGAGLYKTGFMNKIALLILRFGGHSERSITLIIAGTVGFVSSFMQNVGAAALFLPVASRISVRTEIPLSRLLMPMGFCAILGGTMTMVGSSPLILLNDLIETANKDLPDAQKIPLFNLFDVTPIGIALVISGILYFIICGKFVLLHGDRESKGLVAQSTKEYLLKTYQLEADLVEINVPAWSILKGHTIADIMEANHLYVVGVNHGTRHMTPAALETKIEAPSRLLLLGRKEQIADFADIFGLNVLPQLDRFSEDVTSTRAGVAEIVIPPNSEIIGKTAEEIRLRMAYGMSLLAIHRGEETFSHIESQTHQATAIARVPLRSGDTIVVHTDWGALTRLKNDRNFVIVTSGYPQDDLRPHKVTLALFFFAIALGLILFSDLRLSLCLLIGATGMIITRVLSVDEAYSSVSWNTVFLLASLIPLGQAMQATGTAEWMAFHVMRLLEGWPLWALQAGLALLATFFTLVMSNVGATVLLVPLAISIAIAAGGNPAIFALTVALSTSNSFFLPTHQVNALIMVPARYRVIDFMRAGGGMTILFLIVSLGMMQIVFA